MKTTTLRKIRAHGPCKGSWATLLESLGKTAEDDEPLTFNYLLDLLGMQDTLWALRSLTAIESESLAVKLIKAYAEFSAMPLARKTQDLLEKYMSGGKERTDALQELWEIRNRPPGVLRIDSEWISRVAAGLVLSGSSLGAATGARDLAFAVGEASRGEVWAIQCVREWANEENLE